MSCRYFFRPVTSFCHFSGFLKFFENVLHIMLWYSRFSANNSVRITLLIQKCYLMPIKLCYICHFSEIQPKKWDQFMFCDMLEKSTLRYNLNCFVFCYWWTQHWFILWVRCFLYAWMIHSSRKWYFQLHTGTLILLMQPLIALWQEVSDFFSKHM